MKNMELYEQLRAVPATAKRAIQAGRLKGKTDINPMHRIKSLTEAFGPCGIGWWYEIRDQRLEASPTGEVSAFVDIDLYYRWNGEVSHPIPGVGGSSFIANEKSGKYMSDECFKMALTDALSVACKALGCCADVYWDADRTKYSGRTAEETEEPAPKRQAAIPDTKPGCRIPPQSDEAVFCDVCGKRIPDYFDGKELIKAARLAERSKDAHGAVICTSCGKKL